MVAELDEIARTKVGQLVMLPGAPDVLHRIEFGRIGRQLLDYQPALVRGEELLDYPPLAVRRQSVPHHQQLARQVMQQMAEEVDYFRGADGAAIEPEVEIPPVIPAMA